MSVKILYHGHSNLEIYSGGHHILIDPFFTGNSAADMPADKADPTHILITHAHSTTSAMPWPSPAAPSAPITCCFEMYAASAKASAEYLAYEPRRLPQPFLRQSHDDPRARRYVFF